MKIQIRMVGMAAMALGMLCAPARAEEDERAAPAKITGKEFPEMDMKHPEMTQYCSMQFGDGPDDVAYIAYGVRKKEQPSAKDKDAPAAYDLLYVYTPNGPPFQKPRILRGRPTRERLPSGRMSGEYMSFPPFKLQTRKGNAPVTLMVELEYRHQRPGGRLDISMLHEGKNLKFAHELGKWYGQAAEAPLRSKIVFAEPKLSMRILDSGRSVTAILTMGAADRLLMPLNAATTPVMLTVKDGARVVENRKMRVDKDLYAKGSEFMECRLGRLPPGRSYTYELTVDLGPLGKLQAQQEYTTESK